MDTREAEAAGPPALSMRNPAGPYYIGRVRKHLLLWAAIFLVAAGFVAWSNGEGVRRHPFVEATVVAVSLGDVDRSLQYVTYSLVIRYDGMVCDPEVRRLVPVNQPTWRVGSIVTIIGTCSGWIPLDEAIDQELFRAGFHYWPIVAVAAPAGLLLLLVLALPLLVRPVDRHLGRIASRPRPVRVVTWIDYRGATIGLVFVVGGLMEAVYYWYIGDPDGHRVATWWIRALLTFLVIAAIVLAIAIFLHWWEGRSRFAIDDEGISLTGRDTRTRVDFADITSAYYQPKAKTRALLLETRQADPGDPPAVTSVDMRNFSFPQRVRIFAALTGRVTWAAPGVTDVQAAPAVPTP